MTSSAFLPARRLVRPVRRHLLLNRRRWAAFLLLAAVASAMTATRPAPVPVRSVVVAAADLPGGSLLDRRDLVVRRVPTALAPAYASHRLDRLAGRRLAVGVREGEVLAPHRLAGGEQSNAAPGLTTVPVRIADGAELLRPGDVVDLLSADRQGGGHTVARGVPVISAAASDDGRFVEPETATQGDLVLVGVPASLAPSVVGASAAGYLLFTYAP